jgi:hypothetical protein
MWNIRIEVTCISGRIEKAVETSFPTTIVISHELLYHKIVLNSRWIATTQILKISENLRPNTCEY